MKYQIKWDKLIVGILLIILVLVISLFLARCTPIFKLDLSNKTNNNISTKELEKKITSIKEANQDKTLEYESKNLKGLKSLIYLNSSHYESILINTKTGKNVTFLDLIKDKEAFFLKEEELLNLKYPEFIVNVLKTKTGNDFYYVKDNEVIIYYYNYEFPYDIKETLSLTINYNEIKDLLLYTPYLDLEYTNESGYNYDPSKKTVALTFDDGPNRKLNANFLDTLAQNKAHATFFMVGTMMNSCNSCVLNTYESGNEVGSHTYEHLNIKNNSLEKVSTSLTKVNELYTKITGDTIKLVRPPYGAYNSTNLKNINNPLILWNLDTEDWRYRDKNYVVNYIKEHVSDGSIILMHELYESSLEATKEILPWLYAQGYNVVSISELAQIKNRTLEVGKAYSSLK